MHPGSAATLRTAPAPGIPEAIVGVWTDPALPYSAKVAWLPLWCLAGWREGDVTRFLGRVAGFLPESTWRNEAKPALLAAGYLAEHLTPAGHTFTTIHATPDGAQNRLVAPDPQEEFPFAREDAGEGIRDEPSAVCVRNIPFGRDRLDGTGPDGPSTAPHATPTAGIQPAGATQAIAREPGGPDGPAPTGGTDPPRGPPRAETARFSRENRAVFARPTNTKDQEIRARANQYPETKEPSPLEGLGSLENGLVLERAETARISRAPPASAHGGPVSRAAAGQRPVAAVLAEAAASGGLVPDADPARDWVNRAKIAAWVMAEVAGAAADQAQIAAEAVTAGGVEGESLYRALAWARQTHASGAARKDLAALFFGAFQQECRRQGFRWPRKRKPK